MTYYAHLQLTFILLIILGTWCLQYCIKSWCIVLKLLEQAYFLWEWLARRHRSAEIKIIKKYRQYHSRKRNRIANLEDIFYRAMDSSDLIISTMSFEKRIQKRWKLPFPQEVINLFQIPLNPNKLKPRSTMKIYPVFKKLSHL